jgi:glyoxylase I family protein
MANSIALVVEHVFAGIAVSDYHASLRWYESLFGRPPDVVVRDDLESMWQIREGAWVYIVLDGERAGKSLVAVLVPDLQKHLAMLSARGMAVPEMDVAPGLYRKAVLTDRDGNTVTLGENLSSSGGS